MEKSLADVFKGFSKLNREERLRALLDTGLLQEADLNYLANGGLKDFSLGEKFIENVIGYFQLPLGVATNFRIDEKDYLIPMAVEETSIVAAASKTAKWVRENGFIFTEVIGNEIIGQIQFARVNNFEKFSEKQNKLIQIYTGAGFGNASSHIENSLNPDPEISSKIFNIYVQPGITFTGKHLDMAIDLRTKYVKLYDVNAYLYDEFEWWNTDYQYASDSTLSFVLFEPAYTLTAGGKNLKGLFQAGLVIPIINSQDFYSSNSSFFLAYPFFKLSFGMQYRFGRK